MDRIVWLTGNTLASLNSYIFSKAFPRTSEDSERKCGHNVNFSLVINRHQIRAKIHVPSAQQFQTARLKHLPIPHLHRQEYHHKSSHPDTPRTQPQDTRTLLPKITRTRKRRNDTSDTTEARQHSTDCSAVTRVEQFWRRCVENCVEELHSGQWRFSQR